MHDASCRPLATVDPFAFDVEPEVDTLLAQRARVRIPTSAGSSRGRMPGPFCSTVVRMPSRVNACAISIAIGPPPIITMLAGGDVELEQVLAREVAGVGEAGDRRLDRAAAGAEQHVARSITPGPSTVDLVRPREPGRARRRCRGPCRGSACGSSSVAAICAWIAPDALPHEREVDLGLDRRQPVLVGVAHGVRRLRRREQRLGRHASGPQAVAADASTAR